MNRLTKSFPKYGGVVAVSFEWLALLIYYVQYPSYFGNKYPISYYATLTGTRLAFSVCYLIAAVSFWVFATYHLRQRLQTPVKTFAFSMACFAGTALVPYNPVNFASSLAHITFATLTFLSFTVGIFLMARCDDRPTRMVSLVAATISAVLLVLLIITPKGSNLVFPFEEGSWFVCQLWIIWISFRVFRHPQS